MDKPNETPEIIYLIPDSEHGHVWCDDPAPGMGMDPEDAVEYRRADAIPPVFYLCSQKITGNKDTELAAAKARIAELEADNENLRCVMIAAAEEIDEHWDSHCEEDGYGPANLMGRLERGIPSVYAYKSGDFRRMADRIAALENGLRDAFDEGWNAAVGYDFMSLDEEMRDKDRQWLESDSCALLKEK